MWNLGRWHNETYKLLDEIAQWMLINSEAIYGTRALAPHKEGKVCITKKGDNTLYLYYMADENETIPEQIGMTSFSLPSGARVRILGTDSNLKWEREDKGFTVHIPDRLRRLPSANYVWVLKVTYRSENNKMYIRGCKRD